VVSVADSGDEEDVQTQLSAPDVTAGFMVLLRRCYAPDEEASFAKIRKGLGRQLNAADDERSTDVLNQWRTAHNGLLNQTLEELVQEQLIIDRQMPGETPGPDGGAHSSVVRAPASPSELLRAVWYGGMLHWGKHRETMGGHLC
jgi:hypothetical protein